MRFKQKLNLKSRDKLEAVIRRDASL